MSFWDQYRTPAERAQDEQREEHERNHEWPEDWPECEWCREKLDLEAQ